MLNNQIKLKTNGFYSHMTDFVGLVPDATKPGGQRYENLGELDVIGVSADVVYLINKTLVYIQITCL